MQKISVINAVRKCYGNRRPAFKKIYGLTPANFISAIDKLDALRSATQKLDYYFKITGRSFDDTDELYDLGDDIYSLKIKLDKDDDFKERAEWYIDKFQKNDADKLIQEFERRYNKCTYAVEKNKLCDSMLSDVKLKIKNPHSFTYLGYETEVRKKDHSFTQRLDIKDVRHYCEGMSLCNLETHIEQKILDGLKELVSDGLAKVNRSKRVEDDGVTYNNFDELFTEKMKARPDLIEECYEILKNEEIIGEHNNFTASVNGAIVIWYRALASASLLIRPDKYHDNIVTDLLMKKFTGLKLGQTALRESYPGVDKKYSSLFKNNFRIIHNLHK